ncbi:acyl-CoA dehydrogenase family protein [Nocardia terpenica]|uniref:Acyl-CoA dehydrogenase n=1 Tax=Nocardia terpenica TaxID=455432 RepID=A0A164MDP2_9NOCA|nr:acyl-CoA dehydrogenase family protein [Nocardia terpenica]ATL67432.1 acyl-CoA dehydrogenase [Nocardia terpenica]KZM73266.1 acyl-CoA dehydrogenase [Nocardia terpenica]MBF6064123.1 acyl-CoA dehydrogenase family protein [Nocardia terpenica]MBF6106456.1 acyl-CoA dehydrogenase family protein [Nocardia terpenica]MBF6113741.1 acyl-CoA dehydrogenase family protein [Nocardia terpenica]
MSLIKSQPRPDLVDRARDLVEPIRKYVSWHEEHRELHPEVLDMLGRSELLKMRVPARYGGSVADMRTIVDVISELARADGSVGWSCVSFTMASWLSSLVPDETQDVIWNDPEVRFCGSVELNGVAEPTDGGYILNGRWHFNTGSPHATWDAHFAVLKHPDGTGEPALAVVPVSSLTLVDDWHTSGLRGTGSRTSVAKDLFVPEGWLVRMLPMAVEGKLATKLNAEYEAWHVPFMQMAIAVASAPALGMAHAALENYLELVPKRAITYTHYARQSEAPVTHLQLGEAVQLISEAEFHVYRMVDRLDSKAASGEPWTNEEKAIARMDAGAAVGRARQAVDILADAAGASSIYSHVPLQQIQRDIGALHHHAIMYPNTNLETLGRVLLGFEPNTDFL